MRVVLDSNVIIAAFATRGLCQSLFELCLEHHSILLSAELLEEVRRNLLEKIKLPTPRVNDIASFLKDQAVMVSPEPLPGKICRDPDDEKVLSLAVMGKVALIVTGDKDLLVLKVVQGIPIVSPRDFWNRLRKT
jgi:putative PIN family toxin of toxin-antitoxin system